MNIAPAGVMVGFKKRKVANGGNGSSSERHYQETVKIEPNAHELRGVVESEVKEAIPDIVSGEDMNSKVANPNTVVPEPASPATTESAQPATTVQAPPRVSMGISLSMKKPGVSRVLKPAFGADE